MISLARSSVSMLLSPATYASLEHCSIQFGQNSAHCNATIKLKIGQRRPIEWADGKFESKILFKTIEMGMSNKAAAPIVNSERMPYKSDALLRLSAVTAAQTSSGEMGDISDAALGT